MRGYVGPHHPGIVVPGPCRQVPYVAQNEWSKISKSILTLIID
jgi:hypothetical protein